MKEIWKQIPGQDNYQVSSMGRVRTIDRMVPNKKRNRELFYYFLKGRVMKPKLQGGYLKIHLRGDNPKHISVHRLVALTFIPNDLNKEHVNHKNSIKTDNRVCNLEWNTPKENVNHSIMAGTTKPAKGIQFSSRTKFDELQIKVIKSLKNSHLSHNQIANYFGIHRITILDIINNKSWRHI